MAQDEGRAGGKTPGEHGKEGANEAELAGPERDDAGSIGKGGAPTGPVGSDAGNEPSSSEEGTHRADD